MTTVRTVPLTRAEYEQLVDSGLLDNERIELLAGRKVEMSPEGPEHAALIAAVAEQLEQPARAAGLQVRQQHPIALSDVDEPEPDLALVDRRDDHYRTGHPTPASIHLLVEVAQSSVTKDLGEKAERYARAGIPEYWVVDLVARRVGVNRDPDRSSGRYQTVRTAGFGESHTPLALPDCAVVVE